MVTFYCQMCKYKMRPRSTARKDPPSICPACSRRGTMINFGSLTTKFLEEEVEDE